MSSNPATFKFPAQITALTTIGKPYDVSDPAVPNLLLGFARTGPSAGCSVINGGKSKLEFRSVTSRTSDSPQRANERSNIKIKLRTASIPARLSARLLVAPRVDNQWSGGPLPHLPHSVAECS